MLDAAPGSPDSVPMQAAGRTAHGAGTHPGEKLMQALASTLSGQRPIAFNTNLARVSGDVKAGLFLSQLLYWTRVGIEVDSRQGWVFKTREQWEMETGLSRAEQETARQRLSKLGLVQESRFGSPAQLGFRIVPDALGMQVSQLLRQEPVQWTLFELRSEQHIRTLLGRNMAFYKAYVDALGSVPMAVFVTKALAIQKNLLMAQIDKERRLPNKALTEWQHNWFSLSMDQWALETGLRAGQIRKCKQDLGLFNILEEATQTWPRKRQFIRLSMGHLNERLAQSLAEQLVRSAGNSKPSASAGLLQTLMGRVGVDGSAKMAHRFPGKQSATLADIQNSPVASTAASLNCRPTAGFTQTANPVSGFIQASRRDSAIPDASLSMPNATSCSMGGEIEQVGRRVLAPLHARAESGLQLSTTTTTTPPPPPSARTLGTLAVDKRRVVVSSVAIPEEIKPAHTTPPLVEPPLVWPEHMSAEDMAHCGSLLQAVPKHARRQDLLDELAGRMRPGTVKDPVAYLGSLVRRDKAADWQMVLEVAHRARNRRALFAGMAAPLEGSAAHKAAMLLNEMTEAAQKPRAEMPASFKEYLESVRNQTAAKPRGKRDEP